jgi:hypothetical protein
MKLEVDMLNTMPIYREILPIPTILTKRTLRLIAEWLSDMIYGRQS